MVQRRSKRLQPSGWENRHFHNTQSDSTDQAEWLAVLHGSAPMAAGTQDEEMAESADQDILPVGQVPDLLQDKEVVREGAQGAVLEIVETRRRMLGSAYPFELTGNSLAYRPVALPVYAALLAITQAPSLTTGAHADLPRLFEELSLLACQGYLGPEAGGFRTGWPRPDTVSRFQQAIAAVKAAAAPHPTDAEWAWLPEPSLPADPLPASVKEEGLDLVAWRRWGDDRGCPQYLFGQCACGSDWMGKGDDINLRLLERWFRLPKVPPVKSLFVPRYVVPTLMHEMSLKGGLVFDRVRIVQALQAPHVAPKLAALSSRLAASIQISASAPAAKKATANSAPFKPRRRAAP